MIVTTESRWLCLDVKFKWAKHKCVSEKRDKHEKNYVVWNISLMFLSVVGGVLGLVGALASR